MVFLYRILFDRLLSGIRRFIPRFAGMQPGDRVLDVCCGTGTQVIEYARRGLIATGIDLSPAMINAAVKNQARQRVTGVEFRIGDAASLPFPDSYFDYASISLGLHDKNGPLQTRIISEMKRAVKPGGVIIFMDYQVPLPGNLWRPTVRTIESIAGGAHARNFKAFLRDKGLESIIQGQRLPEEKRASLVNRLFVVVKLSNR